MNEVNVSNGAVQKLKAIQKEAVERLQVQRRTALDILNTTEEQNRIIIDPIMERGHVSVFYGESDAGKSQFLQQLVLSLVEGDRKFLNWEYRAEYRRAIYVATEDIEQDVRRVLKRMANPSVSKYLKNLEYIFEDEATESIEKLIKRLEESISVQAVDLIVIDAMMDVFEGSMNDAGQIRKQFMKPLKRLAKESKTHIMVLTHVAKGRQRNGASKDNILGSQAIEASARLVMEYKRDPDPGRDHIRHLCIVKSNYLPPDYKSLSYELERDPHTFRVKATGNRVDTDQLAKQSKTADPEMESKIISRKKSGISNANIAAELGIGESTVQRRVKELIRQGKLNANNKPPKK